MSADFEPATPTRRERIVDAVAVVCLFVGLGLLTLIGGKRTDEVAAESPDDTSWKWAHRAILAIALVCVGMALRGCFR